jgi:RNA polymerase sigma-70 factor (ECF subfamily)
MLTLRVSSVTSGSLEQELERLFREHYQMLYRTAYSLLENSADAEDVPQSLFLQLLRNGMTPDLQKNARGYLYRAAVNLSLNMLRARKRRAFTEGVERLEIQAESSNSNEVEGMHRRLAEAVAELEPEAAQILILRYVHNYSDAEIAKLMGTSRGTIAMRLFRSRARLKNLMRESLGGKQ